MDKPYIVKYYGIEDRVRPVKRSMTALAIDPEFVDRFDSGAVIGVYCPNPPTICEGVQRKIYPTLADGAHLTISNASKVMGNGNEVSEFRDGVLGWGLYYKDENDLKEITGRKGLFKPVEYFYDDFEQNVMLTVRKNGKG